MTRSGGFAGVRQQAEIRLGDDPRTPEVERLLMRIDLRAAASGSRPQPDRFVYEFSVRGEQATVYEPDLTPELERARAPAARPPLRGQSRTQST